MNLEDLRPGAIIPANDEPVVINRDQEVTGITITNTGDVPVHLTAHFHVFEANPRLRVDRRKAFGMRPDVPAGGAVRLEPGATVQVPLVPISGNRIVRGFWGLVEGPLDEADVDDALARALEKGFLHVDED